MDQSKTNSSPEQSQRHELSDYERKRLHNVARNNQFLEDIDMEKHEQSGSSSHPKGLVAKAPSSTTRGRDDKSPVHTSPTRYHVKLQCQEILVVFGSELHCSDPRHPESHNVHFPLNSSQVMSAVAWPGCSKRASGMRSPSSTARRDRTSAPTEHRLLASTQRTRRCSTQCRTCTRKTHARLFCGGGSTCWSARSSIARRPYLSRPTGIASCSVRRPTCSGVCIFCVHSTCFGESLTCF
jgi:hypothetical protein